MDSKVIYICGDYEDHEFKTSRIWRTDGKYEPFVYVIQEVETGMKYIGSKTAKGCLESDLGTKYFTSSKIIKETWSSDEFKILEIIKCASNHDALILEGLLIEEQNAVKSNGYYNKHNKGINFSGHTKMLSEGKHTISEIHKGKINILGNMVDVRKYHDSTHLKEFKKNIPNIRATRKDTGEIVSINSNEYRTNKQNYILSDKVVCVKDPKSNKNILITKEEYNSGNYISSVKGTITAYSTLEGKFVKIPKDKLDNKYFIHPSKGTMKIVDLNDCKVKSIKNEEYDDLIHIKAPFWAANCKNAYKPEKMKGLYALYDIYEMDKEYVATSTLYALNKRYPDLIYPFNSNIVERFIGGYNPYDDEILSLFIDKYLI